MNNFGKTITLFLFLVTAAWCSVVATPVNCGKARAVWTAPTVPFVFYGVCASSPSAPTVCRGIGAAKTAAVVIGLQPQTAYVMSVKAMDRLGVMTEDLGSTSLTTPACQFPLPTTQWTGYMTVERLSRIQDQGASFYTTSDSSFMPGFLMARLASGAQVQLGDAIVSPHAWSFALLNGDPSLLAKRPDATVSFQSFDVTGALIEQQDLGSGMVAGSLLRLRDGRVAVAYSDSKTLEGGAYQVHFRIRQSAGIWTDATVQHPFHIVSGYGVVPATALTQHPVTGNIWVFTKIDAAHVIDAAEFNPSGSLVTVRSAFISQVADGVFGPEGEYPYLQAVPFGNEILLGYESNDWHWLYSEFFGFSIATGGNGIVDFNKTARIALCRIDDNGSRVFSASPAWTERLASFGLSAQGNRAYLIYRYLRPDDLSLDEIWATVYQAGDWSVPQMIGVNGSAWGTVGADGGTAAWGGPPGAMWQVDLSALPGPPSPPPPPSCVPRGKSGKCK